MPCQLRFVGVKISAEWISHCELLPCSGFQERLRTTFRYLQTRTAELPRPQSFFIWRIAISKRPTMRQQRTTRATSLLLWPRVPLNCRTLRPVLMKCWHESQTQTQALVLEPFPGDALLWMWMIAMSAVFRLRLIHLLF